MVARYPDEGEAWQQLAHIYGSHFNEPEKSIDAFESGVKAAPQFGALRNSYGYQLLDMGPLSRSHPAVPGLRRAHAR